MTYGDVNDKKYVKELIYDLLAQEYGVNEKQIYLRQYHLTFHHF